MSVTVATSSSAMKDVGSVQQHHWIKATIDEVLMSCSTSVLSSSSSSSSSLPCRAPSRSSSSSSISSNPSQSSAEDTSLTAEITGTITTNEAATTTTNIKVMQNERIQNGDNDVNGRPPRRSLFRQMLSETKLLLSSLSEPVLNQAMTDVGEPGVASSRSTTKKPKRVSKKLKKLSKEAVDDDTRQGIIIEKIVDKSTLLPEQPVEQQGGEKNKASSSTNNHPSVLKTGGKMTRTTWQAENEKIVCTI